MRSTRLSCALPTTLALILLLIPAHAHAQTFAWVVNQQANTVSVVDVATRAVVNTIGSSPGLGFNGSAQIIVTPDGTRAYVVNAQPSERSLIVLDTATQTPLRRIALPVGFATSGIVFTDDGGLAYLANSDGFNLGVLDVATDVISLSFVTALNRYFGIDLTPDGSRLYTTGFRTPIDPFFNRVTAFEIATGTPSELTTGGLGDGRNAQVVIVANTAYVTGFDTATVYAVDTSIDTVVAEIPVGTNPFGVAASPDGSRIYVSNNGSNNVSVIDTSINSEIARVGVSSNPERGLAVSPDGTEVWVPLFGAPFGSGSSTGSVAVIDTVSHVVSEIPVGAGPVSLAFVELATTLAVEIDIKPGSNPNCFNNNGHGVIPVAILGSAALDVDQIDVPTVRLRGLAVAVRGRGDKTLAHVEDVNGDAFPDLVLQIEDRDGEFTVGDTTAKLSGLLLDGTEFEGEDSICIVQ